MMCSFGAFGILVWFGCCLFGICLLFGCWFLLSGLFSCVCFVFWVVDVEVVLVDLIVAALGRVWVRVWWWVYGLLLVCMLGCDFSLSFC